MTNPLADRIRPERLEQMVGQQHLLGPGKALRQLIESGDIPNLIFYGPPGVGKTTVASIIAKRTDRALRRLNGTNASTADIRALVAELDTLSAPNGILLYGPPGCGKTFFAEKCAEEMQCHFMYVKCSDVASPYIHGGQEKIARLFEEAREKSPTLLFLDEVDALLRTRAKQQNASESGEINEFLCQINNCGESGVFVIAATNMPEEIDEAALRAGRLERKYYIGVPDVETIEKLLEIQLRKRKMDNINIKDIAARLYGRVAADVKLIVDVAARLAFRNHCNISTQLLIEAVRTTPPSVSKAVIEEHLRIKEKFEQKQIEGKRRRIGFQ